MKCGAEEKREGKMRLLCLGCLSLIGVSSHMRGLMMYECIYGFDMLAPEMAVDMES